MKKVRISKKTGIEDLIKEVEKLTDINYHTEARIEIAKFFRFKDYEKIFKLIDQIHSIIGSMPISLVHFRDDMTDEMLDMIKSREGKEVYDMVKRAL